MNIKLAIFDFDGTLMDTQKPIVIAKQQTMKEMGLAIASDQDCISTIGLTAKLGFKKIYPELSEETLDLCVKNYRENFDKVIKSVPPELFPGVKETLDTLGKMGITCTIATSRNKKSLVEFLELSDIKKYFPYILAGEDTPLQKPNPDPVLKTLSDLSFKAEESLVIGDMPYDILMGKNAGTQTCGVTFGNADRETLKKAGANYIIDTMSELLDLF